MKRQLAVVLTLFALCGTAIAQPLTLRDDRNAPIVLQYPPRRIVSLLPSLTESVCAIGACDRIVGTDRFSNWPASVRALPKLGGLDDTQIESVVALRPDVVLVSASERVVDRLEALGLKVLVLDARNHADVRRTLILLGRMLRMSSEAEGVWRRIQREIHVAVERVPVAVRGKRVYFEVDSTPYAAGASSFIGETLEELGMGNAIPAELGPFPKLNPEYIVRVQPDIIVAIRQNLADMPSRPGWSSLRALRTHATCGFTGETYELLIRPGPRMGQAAAVFADCVAGLAEVR